MINLFKITCLKCGYNDVEFIPRTWNGGVDELVCNKCDRKTTTEEWNDYNGKGVE